MIPPTLSPHALERFRLHHPTASSADALQAVARGRLLTLIEARKRQGPGATLLHSYVLTADERGIFVLRDNEVRGYKLLAVALVPQERKLTEKQQSHAEQRRERERADRWASVGEAR